MLGGIFSPGGEMTEGPDFFLGLSLEGKRGDSELFGGSVILEINKFGKHWHLGEGAGGSGSGKVGPCPGLGKRKST